MKIKKLLLLSFIALFAFSACEKDEDDEEVTPTTTNNNNNGGSGNNGGNNNNNGGNAGSDSLNRMSPNLIHYRNLSSGKDTTVSFSYYFAEDGKVYLHQKSNRFSTPQANLMIHFTEGGQPYFPANDKSYTYRTSVSGTRPAQGEWDFRFCPIGGVPGGNKDCFTQDYGSNFSISSTGTLTYKRSGDTFTLSFYDYQTDGFSFSGKIEFTNATVGDPNYDGTFESGSL